VTILRFTTPHSLQHVQNRVCRPCWRMKLRRQRIMRHQLMGSSRICLSTLRIIWILKYTRSVRMRRNFESHRIRVLRNLFERLRRHVVLLVSCGPPKCLICFECTDRSVVTVQEGRQAPQLRLCLPVHLW